jgi:hypothetical protein
VLDISDPQEPVSLLTYATGQWPEDVQVIDGYAYVADNEGGLAVLALKIAGDLNCDGYLNGFDIDPFVQALVTPDAYAAAHPGCHRENADCNGDGAVNGYDTARPQAATKGSVGPPWPTLAAREFARRAKKSSVCSIDPFVLLLTGGSRR